jgi:hypothetical protein
MNTTSGGAVEELVVDIGQRPVVNFAKDDPILLLTLLI